jgi:cyclopropane-fatty-acyl-phospholipid synthase
MATKTLLSNFLKGAGVTLNGTNSFDVRVLNDQLYSKLCLEPSLGAGEAYTAGWWDCDQLDELFFRIFRNDLGQKFNNKWTTAFLTLTNRLVNLQTKMRSKQVAENHYNLGNDLYRAMLGESMAYSCGYWKNAKTLDKAQYDKFDLICRKLNLKPGERVLDIGCGFGTLAKFMAEKYGCKVTGVNISTEQVRYAKRSLLICP